MQRVLPQVLVAPVSRVGKGGYFVQLRVQSRSVWRVKCVNGRGESVKLQKVL